MCAVSVCGEGVCGCEGVHACVCLHQVCAVSVGCVGMCRLCGYVTVCCVCCVGCAGCVGTCGLCGYVRDCVLCGYVWVVWVRVGCIGCTNGWEEPVRSFLAEHYDCMGGSMYIRTDFSWLQSNP